MTARERGEAAKVDAVVLQPQTAAAADPDRHTCGAPCRAGMFMHLGRHFAVRRPRHAREPASDATRRAAVSQYGAHHRHDEFVRFLDRIARTAAAGTPIHAILDKHAAHTHRAVQPWVGKHLRWTFHFTPTSCSSLNAVEGFFARLSHRRLQHGVFLLRPESRTP